jgi:ABC-type multidrug transport system fused ATPase/permease subunit
MFATATRCILGLIAPYRARVALALALAVVTCLLNFPLPLLIQELVDRTVTSGGPSPVLVLGLLGVFAAQAMTTVALAQAIGPVGLGVVRDLRHALYARLQRLGLPFYDRTPAGAIISRLMDDVAVLQALITSQALAILTDLGTTVVVMG